MILHLLLVLIGGVGLAVSMRSIVKSSWDSYVVSAIVSGMCIGSSVYVIVYGLWKNFGN